MQASFSCSHKDPSEQAEDRIIPVRICSTARIGGRRVKQNEACRPARGGSDIDLLGSSSRASVRGCRYQSTVSELEIGTYR